MQKKNLSPLYNAQKDLLTKRPSNDYKEVLMRPSNADLCVVLRVFLLAKMKKEKKALSLIMRKKSF